MLANIFSTAFTPTTLRTTLAASTIDELASTIGACLTCLRAIFDIAFECASDTIGPCGDGVSVEIEFPDKFNHIGDRHAMAEDAGDKLGVVLEFFLEHSREAFDGDMVAVLVRELEVIACMLLTFFLDTDHPSLLNIFG